MVITAVLLQIDVFWDVTSFRLLTIYRRKVQAVQQLDSLTPEDEGITSFPYVGHYVQVSVA